MDNQNTNQLEGMSNNVGQTINPTTINPNPQNLDNNVGAASLEIPPISDSNSTLDTTPKPTMDSILNGEPNTMGNPQVNSTVDGAMNTEPVGQTAPSNISTTQNINNMAQTPVNNTVGMENIQASATPINTTVAPTMTSEPTIETIPTDIPVVNNPASTPSPAENNMIDTTINVTTPSENVTSTPSQPQPQPENTNLGTVDMNQSQMNTNQTNDMGTNPIMPQDDFNAVPTPPAPNNENVKKRKENSKKTLVVVLLIVLIAAIGFGIYYFLIMAKNSSIGVSVSTKDLRLELGDELSKNMEDYAKISGYNKDNCTLDISNINMNQVSTYKFYVTCGTIKSEGTAIVDDTTEPEVITTDVTILPNAPVKAEDFIEKCNDASSCTYEFETDIQNLTASVGEYDVKIVASDDFNNKTTAIAKLIVSANAPVRYMTCTAPEQDVDSIYATLVDSYKIGIDSYNKFYNAVRTSVFSFADAEDYQKAVSSYDKAVGLHNIIGDEIFSASDKSITLKSSKTLADMSKDLNANFPDDATMLSNWLWGVAGYTCK